MLVSEDKIKGLIPQRYPMIMVDRLISCDEKQAVSSLIIRPDNLFLDRNVFTASGVMETMAQTAAARTGFLLTKRADDTNKKPPVGVIGSIKNFRLYFQPQAGSEIITSVTIEHEVMNAVVLRARVEVEGKIAAESDLQIFLTGDEP